MTRAKDISKIVTDADLSGTLDVTGDLSVDNATLKVDSTNNRVGISTSSMTSKFEVAVSDNTAIQEAITIKGTQSGAYGGYLGWKDNWSGDSYTGYRGAIIADVPSANSGRLRFFTANSSTLSEKMRIDSSGNVGIGTSSPNKPLTVFTSAATDSARFTDNTNSEFFVKHSSGNLLTLATGSTSQPMAFGHGTTERMRIAISDSRSVLSIGDTAVYTGITSTAATNSSLISMNSGGGSEIVLSHHDALSTSGLGSITFNRGSAQLSAIGGACDGATDSGNIKFYTTASGGSITERMRLTSNGDLLLQKTSATNSGGGTFFKVPTTPTTMPVYLHFCKTYSGLRDAIVFLHNGSGVGGITFNNTSTSFNTSSDHRLKENVTADWDATTRLKQLNPVRFNFIADADTTVDGFLAHEVQSVVPEAITGTHNEVDDDGNPVYQGIDQSKLVPLLVKTIQELEARIVALETA